jgi:ubiquinone/menaquinone biosynthesis C-methylase UbiE
MTLEKQKGDWEALGRLDPLWAIYSDPKCQHGKWDIEEFFRSGQDDVSALMGEAERIGRPLERVSALDFGCGVGRLTRALAKHFHQCVGVDISREMVNKAKELNQSFSNCTFVVNNAEHLRMFKDGAFDLIYSKWVLQHLPTKDLMKGYAAEFVRTLKRAGLLVFQIRTEIPVRARLQLGRKLYLALQAVGLEEKFLYEHLGLSPMRIAIMPEQEMTRFLQSIDCQIIEVQNYRVRSGAGAVYFVTK